MWSDAARSRPLSRAISWLLWGLGSAGADAIWGCAQSSEREEREREREQAAEVSAFITLSVKEAVRRAELRDESACSSLVVFFHFFQKTKDFRLILTPLLSMG